MAFGEAGEARREEADAEAVGGADADDAGGRRPGALQPGLHGEHLGLDALQGLEERGAGVGQLAAMGAAHEELGAERGFERGHAAGEGRLVDARACGRRRASGRRARRRGTCGRRPSRAAAVNVDSCISVPRSGRLLFVSYNATSSAANMEETMTDLSHYVSRRAGRRAARAGSPTSSTRRPARPRSGCRSPPTDGGRRGRRRRQGGLAGLGEDPAAAAGAHPRPVQVPAAGERRQDRRADLGRARQDPRRRARRGDARARGRRVRGRHPAPAEGRGHRERRHQRRQPLAAPAARGRRRHHAVQLPLHGADVDVPGRARLRQQPSC